MTESESTTEKRSDVIGTCPVCGAAYHDVVDLGPDDLQLVPCGHRVRADRLDADRRATVTPHADGGILIADGGTDWPDLTAFKRDILAAIATLEQGQKLQKGLVVKETLEEHYNEEVHHGRLYPNLHKLADRGLVSITREAYDGRSHKYALTEAGKQTVVSMSRHYAEAASELQPAELEAA